MDSVASEWLDRGASEMEEARNVARMGCVVRRVKLLVHGWGWRRSSVQYACRTSEDGRGGICGASSGNCDSHAKS